MPLKFYHSYLIALTVAVVFSLFAFDTMAADAAETMELFPVDFSPTLLEVIGLIFAGLSVFATYLAGKALALFKVKTGIDLDDSTRQYLLNAVDNGIKLAEKRVKERAENLDPVQFESAIVATALQYLNAMVPDALDYFGLTEDKLKHLIGSRFSIDTGSETK